ncbi:MAG: hypothetical protein PHR68_03165 [Candidatus Gracilibacteria bacterium]|nr:hypothetical protein [Candidatus Gracilibacteria bacterium]
MACDNIQNSRDIYNINENNLDNLPDDEDKVFFDEYFKNKNYFLQFELNKNKLTDLERINVAHYPDDILDNLLNLGVIRIKNLLGYFVNGLISKEQLNKYSQKLINLIPKQILNEKFFKVGDPVTRQELIDYKNSNFIDETLLNKYLLLIEERDKIRKENQKNKTIIIDETRYKYSK